MAQTLTGRFDTRRDAELAIEQLVQTHGVKRETISVTPVGAQNTVGTHVAGSDAPDLQSGTRERDDAALHGAIEVAVILTATSAGIVRRVLTDAGARAIEDE